MFLSQALSYLHHSCSLSSALLLVGAMSMLGTSSACNIPAIIDDIAATSGITTKLVTDLLDGTTLGNPLPFLQLPLADPIISATVAYETPIQFRQIFYHATSTYNAAAMYHPSALDIFGNGDRRICIDEFDTDLDMRVHEQLATMYVFAYGATIFVPESAEQVSFMMDNVLGLPMSNLFNEPIDITTPWGLAREITDEMVEFSMTDGWNSDGSLSNTFNKMPFSDFQLGKEYSTYKTIPNEPRMDKKCKKEWHWEPLLESDGKGYFTKQEHVTPFAGFTGRLYGMTVSEYESFSVPEPNYDYCEEADFVLSEANKMATDDRKKVEIELFDSKFTSLLPMQITWVIQNQLSSFDAWYYDMALVTAMYDATLLVWREKIAFNAVRPTTVVSLLKGEEEVQSYAGPFEGSRMISGFDWQPFIRTMPHAEYPSASSCICTAFAETFQLLTGEDSTGTFPAVMPVPAGSSRTEPGAVPASDMILQYSNWSDIQRACGQSRLHGGMHFSKAVPAGEELCTGIASLIINRAEALKMGDVNGSLANLEDTSIVVKKSAGGKEPQSKKSKKQSKKSSWNMLRK